MLNALCGSVIIAQTPFAEQGAVDPAGIDTLIDFYLRDGACLLRIAPESRVGGPLAPVQDGDPIRLDVSAQRPNLPGGADEPERGRGPRTFPSRRDARGCRALFLDRVRQAGEGSDFGLLEHGPPTPEPEIH